MMYIGQVLGRDNDRLQPKLENVFRALKLTPPDKVKVVINGQDPYPGGHADGLAFSSGISEIPYSLGVIYDELDREGLGSGAFEMCVRKPSLEDWAEQGVLLLNRTLTTVKGSCNYHGDIGWELLTGRVLQLIAMSIPKMVYMVWGSYAKDTIREFVLPVLKRNEETPLILNAPHPSAQRHGYNFVGCGHFSKCNEYLIAHNKTPIQWNKVD
jgi:uracil-DNA glycosylase